MRNKLSMVRFATIVVLFCTNGSYAADAGPRAYDATFFNQFAPQTALEMVVRIPGFVLREADDDRGLSQGGTNILVNQQPIIGKGETATTQIGQIAAANVIRIEIIDAGTLDLPGFSGLVANIVTRQDTIAGAFEWRPAWRRDNEPELLNGQINASGSVGDLEFTTAFESTIVRAKFEGPEVVVDAAGNEFERRDELRLIDGNQQSYSGSLQWTIGNQRILNAKGSVTRLDLSRPQDSITQALTPRGVDSLNRATFGLAQTTSRLDTDFRFPALGGIQKLIAFVSRRTSVGRTRVTIDDSTQDRIADRRFRDDSTQDESILRLEQSWEDNKKNSWQLALEGAWNTLDLSTRFAIADPNDADTLLVDTPLETEITERRAEFTLAHRRALG
ncbi:MAG: hypothetical protein AAFN07_15910, partial [Pseudomonadota bacterium]